MKRLGTLFIFAISTFYYGQLFGQVSTDSVQVLSMPLACYGGLPVEPYFSKFPIESTVKVDVKDVLPGNRYSPLQMLQGVVPGWTISRPGNDPNGTFWSLIRGQVSLLGPTEPLYVVDGVPGASIALVDPLDITSIQVLKDGASGAFYGARASAGVVLINTKQKYTDGLSVKYSAQVATEDISNEPDFLDAAAYKSAVQKFGKGEDLGSSTDWKDAISRTGFSMAHHLSLSGKHGNTGYQTSLTYRKVDGVQKNSGFQRLNGRFGLSQSALNDRLKLSAGISFMSNDIDLSLPEAYHYADIYNPTAPILSASPTKYGKYYQKEQFDYYNPVAILEQSQRNASDQWMDARVGADFTILPGLEWKNMVAFQRNTYESSSYYNKESYYIGFGKNGLAIRNRFGNDQFVGRTLLQYEKVIKNHYLRLTGGYEYQENTEFGFGLTGGDFLTNSFSYNNLGASGDFPSGLGTAQSYQRQVRRVSFLGKAEVGLHELLFLTINFRREGATTFGKNNQWGNFPGMSLGLNMNKLVHLHFIDQWMLRVGYGVTGYFPEGIPSSRGVVAEGNGYALINGAYRPLPYISIAANPDLKWETKRELNFGTDIQVHKRATLHLDFYTRTIKDIINVVQEPITLYNKYENVSSLKSKGGEIALDVEVIKKNDLTWSVSGNMAWNKTSLVDFTTKDAYTTGYLGGPGLCCASAIVLQEGTPMGQLHAPVFQSIDANGFAKFKDLNGNGIVDDGDYQIIGNAYPKFTYGLGSNLTWKQFDLRLFLRGAVGHTLLKLNSSFSGYATSLYNYNVLSDAVSGDRAKSVATFYSDQDMEKASFLRLEALSLGYTIKTRTESSIRVYIAAQNLFTLTGYSGADPDIRLVDEGENSTWIVNSNAPGIDRRSYYPVTRTWLFGVEFGF